MYLHLNASVRIMSRFINILNLGISMSKFIFAACVTFSLSGVSFAETAKSQWNLVELCKKDCPKAKSDEEAHKCAEKIGKLNKEFRKGQCWEANEKFEAAASKTDEVDAK